MAHTICSSEPEPTFTGTPGASFLELLYEAGKHAERYPSTLDRMVDNALHSTRTDERRKAVDWIHKHASYLYKV